MSPPQTIVSEAGPPVSAAIGLSSGTGAGACCRQTNNTASVGPAVPRHRGRADRLPVRFKIRRRDGPNPRSGELAGMRRGEQRGRGVEFDEVRAYAAGDDVRAIDWRVTARRDPTPNCFMKIVNNPFFADLRAPMKFGSKRCFKSVMSAHLARSPCGPACRGVNGLGVLGDSQLRDTRPKRSQHAVLSMIGDLVSEGVRPRKAATQTRP